MAKLTINIACNNYDRVRAIQDGRVKVEGCEVIFLHTPVAEAFARAFRTADFDVTEMSLSTHLIMTSRNQSPYIGVPAFVSRVFRHSAIYIRTDRGIRSPADLKGKLIGAPEYQMTALLWARGMLKEEYGIEASDIRWRTGGQEQPGGRHERVPITLPPHIESKPIPLERTLSEMLAAGDLDAVVTAHAPSSFVRGEPNIGRLFPDYRAIEEDYYRRTRIFPIMHLIGIRRDLVERHPWLAVNVQKAFTEAKIIAQRELEDVGALHATSPWVVDDLDHTKKIMGPDPWPYGFTANRPQLEKACAYAMEQGLTSRLISPEEMFAPSTCMEYRL